VIWCVLLAASGAGIAHGALLQRGARQGALPLGLVLRLLLVGMFLFAAAALGHVVAGAAGWAMGYSATCLVLVRRWS
jgi:hypothetical protein